MIYRFVSLSLDSLRNIASIIYFSSLSFLNKLSTKSHCLTIRSNCFLLSKDSFGPCYVCITALILMINGIHILLLIMKILWLILILIMWTWCLPIDSNKLLMITIIDGIIWTYCPICVETRIATGESVSRRKLIKLHYVLNRLLSDIYLI